MTTNEVGQVVDTIMSIPGMSEVVKIDLKISRKNVLLLDSIIELGISGKGDEKASALLAHVPPDSLQELKVLSDDCLQKAGLVDLSQKLKSLGATK